MKSTFGARESWLVAMTFATEHAIVDDMLGEATPDDAIRMERDFLLRLVSLSEHQSPTQLVKEALMLVAEHAGATKAYLELAAPGSPGAAWSASIGVDEAFVGDVRRFLSTTVIRQSLVSGELISTSATVDPRFAKAPSVRGNAIEEVLCAPIGQPAMGVVYLQGHTDAPRFPTDARAWAERFARYLAPVAWRVIALAQHEVGDPTAPYRAKLQGSEALVGRSPLLADALRQAAAVAAFDVPVLVLGPSGAGKSELAKIVARSSKRASGPFVVLNCASIPDELLESELFGALPGAHSTAMRKVAGKVEVAEGGTLFLDEIAELSPAAQAKLLQLLQDGTYWPLGASKPSHANVRVIAATNADLLKRVEEKRFREDLYYRLDVMTITLPGLDERRGDIPLMAERILTLQTDRHGLGPMTLGFRARQALMVAEWPGNVRQLVNVVLAGAIRAHAEGLAEIDREHCYPAPAGTKPPQLWQDALRDLQKQMLKDAIHKSDGNVSAAAQLLGIARSYAFELVKSLGLREPPR